jgi:uncharacterized protein YpiB (UPF0302 family)
MSLKLYDMKQAEQEYIANYQLQNSNHKTTVHFNIVVVVKNHKTTVEIKDVSVEATNIEQAFDKLAEHLERAAISIKTRGIPNSVIPNYPF